jgi:hypothetical protein
MMRTLAAVLSGIGALACATPSGAQVPATGPHFTFTVPLRLVNLPPEIQRYDVMCMVNTGPRTPAVGGGITRAVVSGGSVTTDVVVNVSANTLADPALATDYSCSVALIGVAPAGSAPGPLITYLDFGNTRFPLAPGAVFRQVTSGPIPR